MRKTPRAVTRNQTQYRKDKPQEPEKRESSTKRKAFAIPY